MWALVLAMALFAAAPALAGPPGAEGDLYLSTSYSVLQFDGPTGALAGEFVTTGAGGLNIAKGLAFGPNGNLFVASYNTDNVLEYDGATGAFVGVFAQVGGLGFPTGLTFGPNGNLFVASRWSDEVLEYDGATGALIGTFASGGGLSGGRGLTFGPNGNLFVSSWYTDTVIEYDGATGGVIGTFATVGNPMDLVFGPNGNLFVSSWTTDTVEEFDGATGALVGTFASEGLYNPTGLAFGPDGSLFVSNQGSPREITRHYGDTGSLVATFAQGNWAISFLTFKLLAGPFPPPDITGFVPVQADNCAPLVAATVSGTGLVWGAQLRLTRTGEADILGAITGTAPDTAITASFDLGGAATGLWDLVLTYPDDQTDTLVDALDVTACPGPEVTGFSPQAVDNCVPGLLAGATVTGTGFVAVATVTLTMAGQPDIPGTSVDVQSSTILVADFDLSAAVVGLWDVVVTNPDTQNGTLAGGFEITACIPPVIDSISPTRIIHPGSGPLVAGIWVHGSDLSAPGGGWAWPKLTLHRDGSPDLTDSAAQSDGPDSQFFNFNDADLSTAPLGFYDVILTRFDGYSDTVVDGLEIVADPGLRIKRIGAWGGTVQAIDVDPATSLAYVGSGVNLLIFDVSDPANPVELGAVMLDGVIGGLKVKGGYAFVGASKPGYFYVVDVSDPTAPAVVSNIGPNNGGPDHGSYDSVLLDSAGQMAFLHGYGTIVFDITDPVNPIDMDTCSLGSARTISGDLLYSAHRAAGVAVSQVPAVPGCPAGNPIPIGLLYIPELDSDRQLPLGIVVAGDFAYVSAYFTSPVYHSQLFVVDVSDPTAPTHVGTWGDDTGESFARFNSAIAVSDGRLYWAGTSAGDALGRSMAILDIATDPTTPTLIGEYVSDATFVEIEVVGTTAYLGDERQGFTIVDCSDPANPVRDSNYHSPHFLHQATLDGSNLYVTDLHYGLSIIDVADPRTPNFVGKQETRTAAGSTFTYSWGIAVRDGLAYLAAGNAGLQVLDVSDPTAPTLAGEFSPWPASFRSWGLKLSPNEPIAHLGIRNAGGGVFVVNFDVSDLANIIDVGNVFIGSGYPYTIARRPDGIAYIARDNATVTLDLSDALAPTILGETGPPLAIDLALDGDVLCTVNDSPNGPQVSGLDILSVATPDHLPVPLAHYGSSAGGDRADIAVAVANGRAYVGGGNRPAGGVDVLDVTDPTSPLMLAMAPSANAIIGDLILDGPIVYAITRSGNGGAGVLSYLVYEPGDFDDDRDKDLVDFAAFQECFGASGAAVSNTDCVIADFDEDDDVDLDDASLFAEAMVGANPPPDGPVGSCCMPDGTCQDNVAEPYCTWFVSGEYQGDGSTCATVTCPPTGSCCHPFGSVFCDERTEFGCLAVGGTYGGDFTICDGVTCPAGACCDPVDATCTDRSSALCAVAGGNYQGDGTDCATTSCPFGRYTNTISPITQMAVAGAGLQLADDLTLAGVGARDLVSMDLAVFGNGGGAFDVTVRLLTGCPGDFSVLIPNTTFTWTGIPDDGFVYTLVVDPLSPAVTIPDTVWMTASFSTPESGWIIAEQAETGTTADLYARDDPWTCNATFGGNPYAGLWANLRCIEGQSRATGDDRETRLSIERVDTPAPPTIIALPQ